MLTIGSLFSGIGGLELGLERAGFGPVLWQVEIKPECQAVLAAHWPNTERHADIRTVGAAQLAKPGLICGGFPCQDVSSAGKRVGLRGARSGLWFEFRRVVSELHPKWVVVENVASGARAWVDEVSAGLGELGYGIVPIPLEAADVGAPHARARIFLIAVSYAHQNSEHARAEYAEVASASVTSNVDGDRVRNEQGWSGGARGSDSRVIANDGAQPANTQGTGLPCSGRRSRYESSLTEPAHCDWWSAVPEILRVDDGLPRRLDAANARIQALGNAVVPQCAEVIGWVIREIEGWT